MTQQLRIFFFLIGIFLWLGIAMSGVEAVHWILFLPASFFLFAALTGICPGLIAVQKITKITASDETKVESEPDDQFRK